MTREEAIAELKDMPIHYPLTNTYDKASRLIQARDMAIKALVNPQNCDRCEVGNPCIYCKHEFEPQERSGEE